jgi:hypothetical protein
MVAIFSLSFIMEDKETSANVKEEAVYYTMHAKLRANCKPLRETGQLLLLFLVCV